jgi:hypothetical protein
LHDDNDHHDNYVDNDHVDNDHVDNFDDHDSAGSLPGRQHGFVGFRR